MEEENKYLPQVEIQEYGGIFLKVMTDEQMEVLGKQIAAYSTISEQLEELHRTLSHNHDDHLIIGGGGGGGMMRTSLSLLSSSSSMSAYSLMGSSSQNNKLSRRQRWNPTSEQLHILERVFDQEGIRTPNPQKVKDIAIELARHGQIAEPNVYNWFQNRRARLKKKRMFEAEINKVTDQSAAVAAVVVEEDRHEINVSQENALPRTSGAILPVHSFQGCRRPSRDFAEMATHGRMSWEGRRQQ